MVDRIGWSVLSGHDWGEFVAGVVESEIEQGSLIVTSSPSGAEVSVDGEFRGITPYWHTLRGMHQLVIEHPEFEKINMFRWRATAY